MTIEVATYDLLKDIIIPSASIIITLFLGTYIARVLKQKENKAKIKQLLIDHYMQFIVAVSSFNDNEMYYSIIRVLNNLNIPRKGDTELKVSSKWGEKILQKKEQYRSNLNQKPEIIEWTKYTYIFSFLIGKKKYNKYLLNQENLIVQKVMRRKNNGDFTLEDTITNKILNDPEVVEKMVSENEDDIDNAIEEIEIISFESCNDFQYQYFNPYSNQLADLIDEY